MTIATSSAAGRPDVPALLAAAADGDAQAFRQLTAPYRRELLVHCYRMLGSLDDADDAVQESLLKAWRGVAGFQGRSTVRAWLYRIATNVCLDAIDHRARRILPTAIVGAADPHQPPDPDDPEMPWLQPYPDVLLEIVDPDPLADPAAVVVRREHIELAFIAAVQYLPPRQRAVLMLREVLGWSAAETADILGTTSASVNSALQRARSTLEARLPATDRGLTPPAEQAELVARYVRAWHTKDVPGLMALLREDAHMAMPPTPSWYQGRDHVGVYLRQLFAGPRGLDLRVVPTGANRQPALAVYAPAEDGLDYRPLPSRCSPSTTDSSPPSPDLYIRDCSTGSACRYACPPHRAADQRGAALGSCYPLSSSCIGAEYATSRPMKGWRMMAAGQLASWPAMAAVLGAYDAVPPGGLPWLAAALTALTPV